MDGDRPMADRRDLLESELQNLLREAFEEGWEFGDDDLPDPSCAGYAEQREAYEKYDKKLHELLISYFDGETSNVGSQDEASEEGEMGNGVRSESCLRGKSAQMHICEEIPESWAPRPDPRKSMSSHAMLSDFYRSYLHGGDPISKITDAFGKEAELRFRQAGVKKVIGHSELTREPDGSIKATMTFSPDWLEELQSRTIEEFEDEIINGRPRDEDDIRKNGRFDD